MTRVGKIARLPHDIRDVINKRLTDGHLAKDIIEWLNEQPIVKSVLEKEFGGEPINDVNMTAWKQGGYLECQNPESKPASGRSLASFMNNINAVKQMATQSLSDDICLFLSATMAVECEQLNSIADDGERLKARNALLDAFAQLRGVELDGGKLHLDRQKLEDLRQEALCRAKQLEAHPKRTPSEQQARIRKILGTE